MILAIESVILCAAFTLMIWFLSREPVKTLYNYPPNIQERVKTLEEYRDRIQSGQKGRNGPRVSVRHDRNPIQHFDGDGFEAG